MADSDDAPYLSAPDSVYHLEPAAVDGPDGDFHLAFGGYGGTVGVLAGDGTVRWTADLGAFPFAVAAADLDGDGREEVLAAAADGTVTAFGPDGERRWTNTVDRPQYDVAVARTADGPVVVCGGTDRTVRALSPAGEELARHELDVVVHRLAAVDLDADGHEEVLAIDDRTTAEALSCPDLERLWRRDLTVPERMRNWENPGGDFHAFDLTVADLDADGTPDLVFGDAYFNKHAVMATDAGLERRWITDPLPWTVGDEHWYAFYGTAWVEAADLTDRPGREVVAVVGGHVRLFAADGTLIDEATGSVGFADVALDPATRTLYLGSTPNGDDTVYRVDLDGDWTGTVESLERRGRARETGETVAAIRERARERAAEVADDGDDAGGGRPGTGRGRSGGAGGGAPEPAAGSDRPRYVERARLDTDPSSVATAAAELAWFRERAPEGVVPVAGAKLLEPAPPLDPDGEPWNPGRWEVDSIDGTTPVEEIVDLAREIEAREVPTVFLVGHSNMPFLTLDTAERVLEAAPEYCVGFKSMEDEDPDDVGRYVRHYLGPLADLCREHGASLFLTNKNVWWFSMPARPDVYGPLFGAAGDPAGTEADDGGVGAERAATSRRGRDGASVGAGTGARRDAVVPVTEDSNSRTPGLNLLARAGLYQAGVVDGFQVSAIHDLFSYCRFHQYEYPLHGHPFLRLLVVHTLLGGRDYVLRIKHAYRSGEDDTDPDAYAFNRLGREAVEPFLDLLDAGLVETPAPERAAGLCPLGVAVHEPPAAWTADGHNGHRPDRWPHGAAFDTETAVVPHNGVGWGMSPTPGHALQRVLLDKRRQFGNHVPATPYGPVAFVPAAAAGDHVPRIEEWVHTDGVALWRDGGERLTGDAAADHLRSAAERAAAARPVRATGDDAFFHTVARDGGYRCYAVDPGWQDPRERALRLRVDEASVARDALAGEVLGTVDAGDGLDLAVPAGGLRIVDLDVEAD